MLIEQGKISAIQLACMIFPTILATSILSVPSMTMHYAGHDMWLSPIWGALVGLSAIGISLGLNRLYPGMTIIQSSIQIAGWLPGKLIGLAFLLYLPHLIGMILREYGEFISSSALPRTPMFIIMGTMIAVCAINVRLGIEVIGRTSQVFVPILILLLSLTFLLLTGELHIGELLPFMEKGLIPTLKGAIGPSAWLSEYIVLAFLLPYVTNKKKQHMTRIMLWSLGITTATMVISNMFCLMLIGDLTDSFAFPVMIAARYITIADFLQHIEAVIIAVWILGIFVKISVFLYILVVSASEVFGLQSYRPLVAPIAFLCLVYSYWVVSGQPDVSKALGASGNVYTMMFLLVLPAVIYLVALIKQAWGHNNKKRRPA